MQARLAEAYGENALPLWLEVLETPRLSAWAALHVASLIDRVPLDHGVLERVAQLTRENPALKALLRELAFRFSDPEAAALASSPVTYRPSHRLLRWPGPTEVEPATPLALLPARTATDGHLASPAEGPGVYAFRLELAPGHHRLRLRSEGAMRLLVLKGDGSYEALLDHRALSELAPREVDVDFELTPGEAVELHVADRSAVATVVLDLPPPAFLPRENDLASRAVALIGRFELALSRGDFVEAARLRDLLPAQSALTSLFSANFELASAKSRILPEDVTTRRAREHLEDALAREPRLVEARLRLASLLIDIDPARAHREAASLERLDNKAPPAELIAAIDARGDLPLAATLSAARIAALSLSCATLEKDLELRHSELLLRPSEVASRLASTVPPTPACLRARLLQLELLREAYALDAFDRLFAPLEALSRGPARAELDILGARVAIARARWDEAIAFSNRAREDGAGEAADELLGRALRLAGRTFAPTSDFGLPLTDLRSRIHASLGVKVQSDEGGVTTVYDERRIRIAADGRKKVLVHRLLRPLDAASVARIGEVPIPDAAELIIARTWKLERGRPLPSEPEQFLEKTTISLPNVGIGDLVEWAYLVPVMADPKIAPNWVMEPVFFDSEEGRVIESVVSLELEPGARPPVFILDPRIAPPDVESPRAEAPKSARRWTFRHRGAPRFLAEPLEPRPERRRLSLLAHSGLELDAWALAERAELDWATRVTPEVLALLSRIAKTVPEGLPKDPETLLRTAYDVLRREIDESVDDALLTTQTGATSVPASWVLSRGRGARSAVLLGLCRALRLPCEPVLVRPLWEGPLPAFPSHDAFSYPVLRLHKTWLDPSGRWHPWALLPPALHGVPALSLGAMSAINAKPEFLESPPLDNETLGKRRSAIDIAFISPREFHAHGEEHIDGAFAASWRTALTALSEEARTRILASIVGQSLPEVSVDEVTLEHLEDDGKPLVWRWRGRGDQVLPGLRGETRFRVALFPEGLARDTVSLDARVAPLLINRAVNLELEVKVTAPRGHGFPAGPRDLELGGDFARFSRISDFEDGGRILLIRKRFTLFPTIIDSARYAAWSEVAEAIDRADLVELAFARGAPLSARGPDAEE